MDFVQMAIGAGGGLILGAGIGFVIFNSVLTKRKKDIIAEADEKANTIKEKKMLQAKERFLELKEKHEKSINEKNRQYQQQQDKLKHQQKTASKELEDTKRKQRDVDSLKDNVEKQLEIVEKKKSDLDKKNVKAVSLLEEISGMNRDDARTQLLEELKENTKATAGHMMQELIDEAKLKANQEARKIVIQSIQRVATEEAIENSVSVFNIENDDIKGRIIGREGRNIRALESSTGVEIIVDDTPEAIILSCFDPVRREIARLSMHQLVTDGRIHPARIEEVVAKVRKSIEEEIVEVGKRTCIDLGIHGMNSELVRMVGRMKYRSSYGQNLLQHSREVANLSATMAAELGISAKAAKRAGLLHDIGKVPEDESELPHAILGAKLCEKYGEKADIVNAVGAHHDEMEMTTLISPIIQVCDAISGARPGARREVVESYIKRLRDLENVALEYPGVTKSYAIQAGRELRVIVESEKVTDEQSDQLSFDISQKIQNEMTYPGQVKITVIREKRAVNYAR